MERDTIRMLVVRYQRWPPSSIDLTGFKPPPPPATCPVPSRACGTFEPVVRAITSEITPRVEIITPGTCALEVRGPARYFGGEEALRHKVREALRDAVPVDAGTAGIGIADGRFAATLAARRDLTVPPGQSRAFLAPLPLSLLRTSPLGWPPMTATNHSRSRATSRSHSRATNHSPIRGRLPRGGSESTANSFGALGPIGLSDFLELLDLLGIRTFGDIAEISEQAVLERFGRTAWHVHRLARGLDDQPFQAAEAPSEIATLASIDPPAGRADIAAFAARPIAAGLAGQLAAKGVVCTCLRIDIGTDHGERLVRSWRSGDALSAEMMVERVLWQIGGWLAGSVKEPRPSGGITTIRLVADEVLPAGEMQMELWDAASLQTSNRSSSDRRAMRCADRLCGMLGPKGVLTARLRGGRSPRDRILLSPWGSPATPSPTTGISLAQPWPGHHPLPAPAVVHPEPVRTEVLAGDGTPVSVSGRGELSAPPALASFAGSPWIPITAWAGPWLADEGWWDPLKRRRRAWFQVLTEGPAEAGEGSGAAVAHLCFVEKGHWWVDATYD